MPTAGHWRAQRDHRHRHEHINWLNESRHTLRVQWIAAYTQTSDHEGKQHANRGSTSAVPSFTLTVLRVKPVLRCPSKPTKPTAPPYLCVFDNKEVTVEQAHKKHSTINKQGMLVKKEKTQSKDTHQNNGICFEHDNGHRPKLPTNTLTKGGYTCQQETQLRHIYIRPPDDHPFSQNFNVAFCGR